MSNLPANWDSLDTETQIRWTYTIGDKAEFAAILRGQMPLEPNGKTADLTAWELAQLVWLLDASGLVGPLDVDE